MKSSRKIHIKMRLIPSVTRSKIVKLKGEENKYRLRLGKYRFLYEIIEEQILVYAYKANSRGDVYK
ncbi:MAG: hypothetical protein K2N69_07445 [Helicobacter sp.]|nr:hypothetical protein [Helicobacter sp.]